MQVVAVTKLSDGVTAGVSLMKQQVAEEEEEEEEMGELAGNANRPSPVSVLDSASFEELTDTPKCVKSSTISHEGKRSWMVSCYVFLTERKKVIVS